MRFTFNLSITKFKYFLNSLITESFFKQKVVTVKISKVNKTETMLIG